MNKKLAIRVPIFFSLYIAVTLGILHFASTKLPVFFTNLLSLSYFVFLPLVFLLKPLGLWTGEYWSGPTVMGCIVGLVIYDGILFLLFWGFGKIGGNGQT